MLSALNATLKRMQQNGLRLNRSKCIFAATSLECLGHRIDRHGLHKSDRHIAAIRDAPKPSTPEELQLFLGAPHMGGVWERMVRSVKAAISTEVKNTPDDETFETILHDAEAMINSRPLTYVPIDPENLEAITPNHFLLGSSSGVKKQPTLPTNYRDGLRGNYTLTQHILDGMWRRWIKEYIPVITRQCKWFENVREIRPGDLVLIVEGTIRNHWKRGIVEDVITGSDGHVRQAWVRTATGTVRRPVVRLALLDIKTG
uniref:DUF5641 domain-containing protein n=1 Tax=Anopheles stephensi TaxID=30069 RepID=A0A182YRZ7_ANOST